MALRASHTIYKPLIRRSIDLCRLYRRVAVVAREPGLRMVLNENAHTLDLLIAELQAQLRSDGGTASPRGSWRGAWICRFAGRFPYPAPRSDSDWIRLLARHEVALLHAFERATIAIAPADVALVLRRQLPRLHGIHLDMHGLGSAVRY